MNLAGHDIGVCSWSLRPRDIAHLIAQVRHLDLAHLQLALTPLLALSDAERALQIDQLRQSQLEITAGMVSFPGENYASIATIRETGGFVPADQWEARQKLTVDAARLCLELGTHLLSTHVGFIPPSNHPHYQTLIARVREVAVQLNDLGVALLMETGQEQANELLQFLNDLALANVGVNFDPANMLLYGAGDPIDAAHTLGRHIHQVHIKDARLSDQPGVTWGQEVPFGAGEVDPHALLEALDDVQYPGPFLIERESGQDRVADIRSAILTLRQLAKPTA